MTAPEQMPLPRRLGLLGAAAVLIGSTIGSGIFRSPVSIADRLPGALPLMAVWTVGGVLALCGALTLPLRQRHRGSDCHRHARRGEVADLAARRLALRDHDKTAA
jgi:hypothetical protein